MEKEGCDALAAYPSSLARRAPALRAAAGPDLDRLVHPHPCPPGATTRPFGQFHSRASIDTIHTTVPMRRPGLDHSCSLRRRNMRKTLAVIVASVFVAGSAMAQTQGGTAGAGGAGGAGAAGAGAAGAAAVGGITAGIVAAAVAVAAVAVAASTSNDNNQTTTTTTNP